MSTFTNKNFTPAKNDFICKMEEDGYSDCQIQIIISWFHANLSVRQAELIIDKRMTARQMHNGMLAITGGFYSQFTSSFKEWRLLDMNKQSLERIMLWYRPELTDTQMYYFVENYEIHSARISDNEVRYKVSLLILENS